MDQIKFVEDILQKIWINMVCLDCLPQILLDPFLNTLIHLGHCQASVLELFSENSL